MSTAPETVLADIPGWENAQVNALHGGLTNRTWLVDKGDRKAVLKIDAVPRSAPYNSRQAEARIQTTAAEQGLANEVILASDTVYMTEYLEGDVWLITCLQKDENLDALAAALRSLHSLPLTGRTFDAVGAARDYARRIEKADSTKVSELLQKIESMPLPHNLCCCHNDLVVENIVTATDVRFIDWEYACDNDPCFDLATIVVHHKLSSERRDYLLSAYFDGDGERWREQLSRQAELYEALLWLWQRAARRSDAGHDN
jgi:thiamine kinase-like enzyme